MTSSRNPSAGGFGAFGLASTLVSAVTALGYEEPTPVQRETIPLLLAGRDLLGAGGNRHRQDRGVRAADAAAPARRAPTAGADATRGLVLVPTRELAMQVAEAIHKYAEGTRAVRRAASTAARRCRSRSARSSAAPTSSSPRRAARSITSGARRCKLDALRVLVLDEADEMLDMGFAEDLDAILEATPDDAADGALLGDDAAAHPVDRAAAPEATRRA